MAYVDYLRLILTVSGWGANLILPQVDQSMQDIIEGAGSGIAHVGHLGKPENSTR